MSGLSYAEPKRLLLGVGDLYINNIWVGALKGSTIFHYKPTVAEQQPGDVMAPVAARRTKEDVTIEVEICDFKVAQLRRALNTNTAVDSTAVTIRKREQLTLPSATAVTTAETMIAGSLKVQKLDRSTVYVSGTDYTATTTLITRKSGAITAGQVVLAEYNFSDSGARSVLMGGELTAFNTFEADFVCRMEDGKLVQITLFKAYCTGDLNWAFNELTGGKFTTYHSVYKGLVDLTKAAGSNLFRITEEDGSTTVNG